MAADERILRRRAQFVGAALLVAGCTERRAHEVSPLPSAEQKPVSSVPPPAAPEPVLPETPRPPRTAKVSNDAGADLASALSRIEAMFARVDAASRMIPAGCDLGDTACRARWKAVAEKLAQIEDAFWGFHGSWCPPKTSDAKAIDALIADHQVWLRTWFDRIRRTAVDTLEKHSGADGGSVFQEMFLEEARKNPHPCLSIACPP